jgi:heme exporter protein A
MVIPMTPLPFLDVSDFSYAKGGRFLFKSLSFKLSGGEAFALIGPNGSGKTTLLRCLAGIPDILRGISKKNSLTQSYVGHLNALKARMTVRENLLTQTGKSLERITTLLEEMKLTPLADRQISTLSAGQRRQVALMRLPLSEATLWLIDEPTTHLDEAAAMRFWNILDTHLKKGGAAVLTSHTPIPLPHAKVIRLHG